MNSSRAILNTEQCSVGSQWRVLMQDLDTNPIGNMWETSLHVDYDITYMLSWAGGQT